jgi:hypothetical protein
MALKKWIQGDFLQEKASLPGSVMIMRKSGYKQGISVTI